MSNNAAGGSEKEIVGPFERRVRLSTDVSEQVNKSLTRQMFPALNVVTRLDHLLSLQTIPIVNAVTRLDHLLSLQTTPIVNVVTQLNQFLSRQMITNINLLGRAGLSVLDHLDYVFEARKKGGLLEEHGWFPHYTMPEEIFAKGDEGSDFDNQLLSYYRQNWREVQETLKKNLFTYLVDDATKAIYCQAIAAHDRGDCDLVPRALIPEIERIVRMELYRNAVGGFQVGKLIYDCFADAPPSIFPDRSFMFIGFELLTGHIYESIKDEDTRLQFSKHPIPNRHATLHGLIAYSSEKNSLNSIFVTEYVMQLITTWKMSERHVSLLV